MNFVSLVLALAILAMVAPHIDGWLSRLTGFKAGGLEIQLAANARANHKFAVTDNMESFARSGVFTTLASYSERIQDDIAYFRTIELTDIVASHMKMRSNPPGHQETLTRQQQTLRRYLSSAEDMQRVFHQLISPMAKCFHVLIKSGIDVERLREILKPHGNSLRKIIFGQDNPTLSGENDHQVFWEGLLQAAEEVDKVRPHTSPACSRITKEYREHNPLLSNRTAYPRISEYRTLPHLYVAAASLMFFVNETEVAVRILDEFRSEIAFVDYAFLIMLSNFSFFLGRPTTEIIEPLEEIRRVAHERQHKLARHCQQTPCNSWTKALIEHVRLRERRAELLAMNAIAYRATEEIARGTISSKGVEGTAEKFALALKTVVENNTSEAQPHTLTNLRTLTPMPLSS